MMPPPIWYEQTVAQRAWAMRWYADRSDECATYQKRISELTNNDEIVKREAALRYLTNTADAFRLRDLADEMERTGKVLA